jgi:hypothetical protein
MVKAFLRQLTTLTRWTTRPGCNQPAPFRPQIDCLENRWLPSAYGWFGGSGLWGDEMNWFNEQGLHHGVPGAMDTASIGSGTVMLGGAAVGALEMSGGTLTAGSLEVVQQMDWAGGSMQGGGSTTIDATAVLNIVAPVSLMQWTLDNAGTTNWTGATIAVGGSTIDNLAGAAFNALDDGAMATAGGTWTFHNQGLFHKTGGSSLGQTLIGPGSIFTNDGTVQIDVGTLYLAGTFTNFSGGTATLTGGICLIQGLFEFNDANIVTNAAKIVLDGPGAAVIDQFGDNGLTYFAYNAPAGNFTLKDGAVFSTYSDLLNAGIVLVNDVSQLYVNGYYTQQGGSTTLTGSYVYAYYVDIQAGQLIGWGTVDSSVQSEAEVDVGGLKNPDPQTSTVGTLEITGDYTQAGNATLQIKLGGVHANEYDHLKVDGLMTLDGTLVVVRVNGFQPAFFDNFQILYYTARAGDFATVVPPDGYRYTDYSYFDDQGFLNIALDLAP